MKKIAFLFPGQGSQSVGMGLDFYQEYDFVREIFDTAEEVTGLKISELCFKGPMGDLTKTINLQPSITAVNLACLAAIEKQGIKPDISAGHSLGEYSALHASGVIPIEDTFRLVFKRGELMHRESTKHKGAMHALIGLPIETVQKLIDNIQTKGVVSVANHNAEHQIVITGSPGSVKELASIAASHKARAIPLKVSGAWHSELMKGAVKEFEEFLGTVSFNNPECSIAHNVTGDFNNGLDEIKAIMAKQLYNPVRWHDSMCRIVEKKVDIFVEIGSGKVLSGLLKKILPKSSHCKIYNVNNLKSFEQFCKAVST